MGRNTKTTIPGGCLAHYIISDDCRANRGNDGAFQYAVNGLMRGYDSVLMNVGKDKAVNTNFHLALVIEEGVEVRQELADSLEERLRRAYNQRDDGDFEQTLQELLSCVHY